MTTAKLYLLLALLKTYRATLTWAVAGNEWGHDRYRVNADKVIRDVRFAIANGGFYRIPELQIRDAA